MYREEEAKMVEYREECKEVGGQVRATGITSLALPHPPPPLFLYSACSHTPPSTGCHGKHLCEPPPHHYAHSTTLSNVSSSLASQVCALGGEGGSLC